MNELLIRIKKFNNDRDWNQFHAPVNLVKSISIESAELLEQYQWSDTARDLSAVKEELADILIYCLQLAMALDLDVNDIINEKMDKNEKKYPVDLARGNSKKYSEF